MVIEAMKVKLDTHKVFLKVEQFTYHHITKIGADASSKPHMGKWKGGSLILKTW